MEKIKKYAALQSKELNELLEEIINENINMLKSMEEENIIDFEPIEIKGKASEILRKMRYEK